MYPLFRVKICGVTSAEDARAAAAAGAGAIGLNFYRQTPRYVAPATAREIREEIPPEICVVGVFVNAAAAEVADLADRVNLDAVQLHGDEPPEYLAELRAAGGRLKEIPLLRAFRCRDNDYDQISAYLNRAGSLGLRIDAALIDAFVPGKYGGGGATVDWRAFRAARRRWTGLPVVLAGGLTPENVEAAIRQAQPDAVDVASGVELAPGIKDPTAMRRFVANAVRGFAAGERDAERGPA